MNMAKIQAAISRTSFWNRKSAAGSDSGQLSENGTDSAAPVSQESASRTAESKDSPAPKTEPAPCTEAAILVLGEAGEIVSARDACHPLFGWEPSELVGQNIRVLLKRGLDNEVGQYLHALGTGKGT